MKKLHYGHCLIGVAIAGTLFVFLGARAGRLGILAYVLLCPVMMIAIMKMAIGGGDEASDSKHGGTRRRG